MTVSIWTTAIILHKATSFWGYDNHPEYAITITFMHHELKGPPSTKKFLISELVDHVITEPEVVTAPNIPLPGLDNIGCPTQLTVSVEDNQRTRDHTDARWTPEIRVCVAKAAAEEDHCCTPFVFEEHYIDAEFEENGPRVYQAKTKGINFYGDKYGRAPVRHFRRKMVNRATFETCANHPDTEFDDPMWVVAQMEPPSFWKLKK